MNLQQKVKKPTMPNYLILESPPAKKQDGFKEAPKVHVSELSEEQALEFANLMKDTFIEHHKKLVSNKEM